MMIGCKRFNIYLLLALAVLAGGCSTDKDPTKKLMATFRVHLQTRADDSNRTIAVPVLRANPVTIVVEKEPFLNEANVVSADIVEVVGGFDLRVQLDQEGTYLLQNYSAGHIGQHAAIFSQFGEKGKQARWLGVIKFTRVITSGIIQFTPDTTRAEADFVAIGLNHVGKKNQDASKW